MNSLDIKELKDSIRYTIGLAITGGITDESRVFDFTMTMIKQNNPPMDDAYLSQIIQNILDEAYLKLEEVN